MMVRQNLKGLASGACVTAAAFLFTASAVHAASTVPNSTAQQRPSWLGVSGSGENFLKINGQDYCYAGTLGSLVQDVSSHKLYVLSNNHVLAGEISTTDPGGLGDGTSSNIIQPGLLDENGDPNSCSPASTNYDPYTVGTLSDSNTLDFAGGSNEIDAAIAQVSDKCTSSSTGWPDGGGSCIDISGRILDIGYLSGSTKAATVGMPVEKSGRTSGLTTGTVGAIDVAVTVTYSDGTANFVNQILVSGDKGAFIKAGDSGSLLVTQTSGGLPPDAVGLLFAGSRNGIAIANPIGPVLDYFNVSMVGCSSCTNSGTSGGGTGGGGGHGKGPKYAVDQMNIAKGVLDSHRALLMTNPDVVGTGLSVDHNGMPVIQVYTKSALRSVGHPIPSQLEGVKVEVVVTGEFKAN